LAVLVEQTGAVDTVPQTGDQQAWVLALAVAEHNLALEQHMLVGQVAELLP
jgi:hypothetical protein